MWARNIELMLSLFLSLSYFLYPGSKAFPIFWLGDLIAATLIVCFSLLSYQPKFHRMNLFTLIISLYLMSIGYFLAPLSYSLSQHDLVIGFILAMLAIVPSHSTLPPKRWIEFLNKKEK